MDRKTRSSRTLHPNFDSLEGRRLLNGGRIITRTGEPINDQDLQHYQVQKQNNVPIRFRRMSFPAPGGGTILVTLYGFGTLRGTRLGPDGNLNVVFDNTQSTTRIIGKVIGGNGQAGLRSIRDADVLAGSGTAVGVNPIGTVNFRQFNLVNHGRINLRGGVVTLALRSVGQNTEVNVKDGATTTSNAEATLDAELIQAVQTSSQAAGFATGTSGTSLGVGGAPVIGGNTGGAVALSSGVTAAVPEFTGVQILINQGVNAGPLETPPLQNPQVFSIDATGPTPLLLRFDAKKGTLLQTIPVPTPNSTDIHLGLGRDGTRQVALVGQGSTLYAFDVISGAFRGSFSTANIGITEVDGIGATEVRTLITAAGTGPAVVVNVTASLATGQAVQVGSSFTPQREFLFTGGATGVAGSGTIYAAGAAHFDTFQPNLDQFGIMAISSNRATLTEVSRTALPSGVTGNSFINAGTPPNVDPSPFFGLGSINNQLAILGTIDKGKVPIKLVDPRTLATAGAVSLTYPNQLTGLTESFHPELLNAAIFNVDGNLKTFGAHTARGAVVNVTAAINLVSIRKATDVAIVGKPVNHVEIPVRDNVQIISTEADNLPLGTPQNRNGTTIITNLGTTGPLVLP